MSKTESPVVFEDPDAVFEVLFGCSNCGASWLGRYRAKTRVGRQTVSHVYVVDKTHNHFPITNCDYCCHVICPVCKFEKHVTIEDRRPYGNDR